jgi:UDP-N-acetyl-2-amino-2-deoxyglucuronate dehydrogenase
MTAPSPGTAPAGVALIGAGAVAPMYLAALAGLPALRLAGVLARSEGRARALLDRHPVAGAVAYPALDDLVADPAVGFVVLATPPDAREDIVGRLVAAGRPVLMEKPVERSLAAARRIVAGAEAAGVPLGVVLQHRARPAAQALRARLPALGPVRAAEIAVPWWRPQGYYDQPGRGTYARDGGGVLLTQAIHTLDLALSFLPPVAEVTAMTATTGLHRMEAEDFAVAGLACAGGAVASLFATTAAFPGRAEEIVLHFDTASARLTGNRLSLAHHDGREETAGGDASTGAGADPMAFSADWHRAVIADFAESLAAGRPPMVPGREALKVHALIDAIEAAARSGTRTAVAAA